MADEGTERVIVAGLIPGDKVHQAGRSAVFVAQTQHPIWPHLQLVVWKHDDGTWSHDALDARQEVGECSASTVIERQRRVQQALLGRSWA